VAASRPSEETDVGQVAAITGLSRPTATAPSSGAEAPGNAPHDACLTSWGRANICRNWAATFSSPSSDNWPVRRTWANVYWPNTTRRRHAASVVIATSKGLLPAPAQGRQCAAEHTRGQPQRRV